MRTFAFTDDEVETLRHGRLNHPTPAARVRLDVLWLKSRGVAHVEIARLTGLSRRTVQRYLDDYLARGLDASVAPRRRPPAGKLLDHKDALEDHFLTSPPATVAQARADIERLTGLRRGLTQVRVFLKGISACVGARAVRSPPRPTSNGNARSWRRS